VQWSVVTLKKEQKEYQITPKINKQPKITKINKDLKHTYDEELSLAQQILDRL
jgi:hypothetical protein